MMSSGLPDTLPAPRTVGLAGQIQRFCPFCDRVFIEAEAVLRCEGCNVLHHPGCWVKNDGCHSPGEHVRSPVAVAYTSQRPPATVESHPAEGTRINLAAQREALSARAAPETAETAVIGSGDAPAVIGGSPDGANGDWNDPAHSPFARKRPPAPYVVGEPGGPKRYTPPVEPTVERKPLPKLYGGPRFLAYWYVPAAVLLAIGVAVGVIFGAEKLFGGDEGTPAAVIAPATSPSPATSAAATPSITATAAQSATATASVPAGKFRPGETLVVAGAGDCLNVRTAPGRSNEAIVCLPDGAEVLVKAGPETAGDLRWWKVQTPQGEGWAAEDFLARKP